MTGEEIVDAVAGVISKSDLSCVERRRVLWELASEFWQVMFPEGISDQDMHARWETIIYAKNLRTREDADRILQVLEWPATGAKLQWLDERCELPGPKWLRELIGVDFFAEVSAVIFLDEDAADVSPLAKATRLTRFEAFHTEVSNLSPLAELANLTWLVLDDTQVSDLSPLAS